MSSSDFANVYASINNLQNQFDEITGNTLSNYNQLSRIIAQQGNIYNTIYYGTGNLSTGNLTVNNNSSINGNLNVDSGTFLVDSINNRVGIRNTNPQYALDIVGSANISSTLYSYGSIQNSGYLSFGNIGNTNSDISVGDRDTNSSTYSGGMLLRTGVLTLYQSGIGSYDSTVSGLTGYTGFDSVIQFRPSNPVGALGYLTQFGFPYILSGNTYTTYPQIFCIGQNNGGTDPDVNSTFHATKGLQLTNASYYANWTDSMTTMTNETLRVNGDTYMPVGQLRLNSGNIFVSNGSLAIGASTVSANLNVVGNALISGNLNVDDGLLWTDPINNRVGILNTNPQYALDINGSSNISGQMIFNSSVLFGNPSTTTGILRYTRQSNVHYLQAGIEAVSGSAADLFVANYLTSTTTSARKFMIKANGNVGIQTSDPLYELDVKGSANISSSLITSYVTPNYDSGWFAVALSTSYSRSLGFTMDLTQPPTFKVLFSTTSAGTIGDGTGTANVVCDITSQGVNAGFAQSYALRYSSSTSVILRTGSSALALYYNGATTVTATTGYYRLFAY